MIGNDIVDLQEAALHSNWRRQGWLQKVCTPEEIARIASSDHPDQLVWKLWSRKEAAYKAHQRRFPHHAKLNPIQFECTQDYVLHDDQIYVTSTTITKSYIYSWVIPDETKYISKICVFPDQVKEELISFFSSKYGVSISDIQIQKTAHNIPGIAINGKKTKDFVSITHHGKYGGFLVMNS